MTSKETLIMAVDSALKASKEIGIGHFCEFKEDDEAFYFTLCGQNGEPVFINGCCKVWKESLDSEIVSCYDIDFERMSPVQIPEERKTVFRELKIFDDEFLN